VLGVAVLGVAALGAVAFGVAEFSIQSCGEEEGIWMSFSLILTQSATSSAHFMYTCRN
jgi:hypothetical protein